MAKTGSGPWSTLAFRRFGETSRSEHVFDEGSVSLSANPDGSFVVSATDFSSKGIVTLVSPTEAICQFDNGRAQSTIIPAGNKLHIYTGDQHYTLHRPQSALEEDGGSGTTAVDKLVSPMPATVIDVKVQPGDHVTAGQVCAVLESMKMEINIRAGRDGVVGKVVAVKGSTVEEGSVLVVLEAEEKSD